MYSTCIIKNISGTNQSVQGVVLAPNDTYQIPDSKRVNAANDSSIITRIASSTLQIGNGSSFITDIAAQVARLSDFISSIAISEINAVFPAPTLTPKFKVEFSNSSIDLNNSSQSFNEVYNFNGSGKLHSIFLNFNSDNVICKLTIDSNIIFSIDCGLLESSDLLSSEIVEKFNSLSWNSSKNTLSFSLKDPIEFSTNVKIEVKSNSSSNSRRLKSHIVEITKY